MEHIHLFQHTGGGCAIQCNNDACNFCGNLNKKCDDDYKCECGAKFRIYSCPAVHFTMPNYIAGKETPDTLTEEELK